MNNKDVKCDTESIKEMYQQNLTMARELLASLPVAEKREPNIKGLWVYQQTIHYCLSQELKSLGFSPTFEEEVSLFGRVKIDLLVNNKVAIEIKSGGTFGKEDMEKYKKYRAKAEERGWIYLYLTGSENYNPYRSEAISIFGKENAFFLDTQGEWARFVRVVRKALE